MPFFAKIGILSAYILEGKIAKNKTFQISLVVDIHSIAFTCQYLLDWRPHEESNLDLRFRKPLFYPLNYGDLNNKSGSIY
jgi:hypothetical protein